MFGLFKSDTDRLHSEALELNKPKYVEVDALSNYTNGAFTGDKFSGSFGEMVDGVDYYTLRQRSAQVFEQNLYGQGLINRLVTNEIGTGLTPEAVPDSNTVGVDEDTLQAWSENIEVRSHLWGMSKSASDYLGEVTFGEQQQIARRESLIGGDVLVISRVSKKTESVNIELIRGEHVVGSLDDKPHGKNEISHGVEHTPEGKVVAYWVRDVDGASTRITARTKTGRLQAWLVFGTPKRLGVFRGMPLLGILLQSMREIDRYRDAVGRKAVINSTLTMFIERSAEGIATRPISQGAALKSSVQVPDEATGSRTFKTAANLPGATMEALAVGEKPVAFNSATTDLQFGPFEEAMTSAMAWAIEMPPNILRLAFSSNYSASQAEINEFKIYLNKFWFLFGSNFCNPIYAEMLINDALRGKIEAPGLLESWRDPARWDEFTSWTSAQWFGSIKPSTDMLKQAKGSILLIENALSTNARESRGLTGTKFTENIKRLKRENELKADMMRPILELKKQYGIDPDADINAILAEADHHDTI